VKYPGALLIYGYLACCANGCCRGAARKKIVGWKAGFLIGWQASDWHAEQIRFYALLVGMAGTLLAVLLVLLALSQSGRLT